MTFLVQPDEGIAATLAAAVAGLDVSIHLFTNNLQPTKDLDPSSLHEPTFSGYLPVSVSPLGPVAVSDHIATQAWDDANFEHDGGAGSDQVYGYFAKDVGGAVLWVQRDHRAPITLAAVPDRYRVRPRFTWESKYPLVEVPTVPTIVGAGGGAGDGSAGTVSGHVITGSGGALGGGLAGLVAGHVRAGAGGGLGGGAADLVYTPASGTVVDFDTPGSTSYTFPSGTTVAKIECWSAARAGENGSGGSSGVGGVGGGYARVDALAVDDVTSYPVVVGTGAAPGTSTVGDSEFGFTPDCRAVHASNGTFPFGDVTFSGGAGGLNSFGDGTGGGGGSAAGASGNGNAGTDGSATAGVGGAAVNGGGAGGDGGDNVANAGNGVQPGGAGGGGGQGTGAGNGAHGRVRLTF